MKSSGPDIVELEYRIGFIQGKVETLENLNRRNEDRVSDLERRLETFQADLRLEVDDIKTAFNSRMGAMEAAFTARTSTLEKRIIIVGAGIVAGTPVSINLLEQLHAAF